jgi:hypothetical protein
MSRPEDYLRSEGSLRRDGLGEVAEVGRSDALGRTPLEIAKSTPPEKSDTWKSESGRKASPAQTPKGEDVSSPMQVDAPAEIQESAEGEEKAEEAPGGSAGAEKVEEKEGGDAGAEPSKDLILSEMEQVDSEIERLERQLSSMVAAEKGDGTAAGEAAAELGGVKAPPDEEGKEEPIQAVESIHTEPITEKEDAEPTAEKVDAGEPAEEKHSLEEKQPADSVHGGPKPAVNEEGAEAGKEAAAVEIQEKEGTPKASEVPAKMGSLKWKWSNSHIVDGPAGKKQEAAGAEEEEERTPTVSKPQGEIAAKSEGGDKMDIDGEKEALVEPADDAVALPRVKQELDPLCLGGPDPFLKFEQIIASHDGLERYLAEKVPPDPQKTTPKMELRSDHLDELILSAGYQDRGVFVQARIWANREKARRSENALQHLLPAGCELDDGPLYTCPEEAPYWQVNEESHSRIEELMKARLQEKNKELKFMERVLALR